MENLFLLTASRSSALATTIFGLCGLLLTGNSIAQSKMVHPNQKIYVATAFGPDGRLWRVAPAQKFVAVDYSQDYGISFSKPVRINRQEQNINHWDENPPSITVDAKGQVSVLYFADAKQDNTSFFSTSQDSIHFSKPIKISKKADTTYQYQAEMLSDTTGKIHFIWHDNRDTQDYIQHGGGDLSLYYAATQQAKNRQFFNEHRIAKNICSCCRTAIALDTDNTPVILARFVYSDNIRDHGIFSLNTEGNAAASWRVTFDDWKIEGCPTSGPALSISNDGRYHISWFTQGKQGTGLYYAWSDTKGKTFSPKLKIGNPEKMSGKADVLAVGHKVALAWKTFDGIKTRIEIIHSEDRGIHWSNAKSIAETESQSQHPALISDGNRIFLAWSSLDHGFQLLSIE